MAVIHTWKSGSYETETGPLTRLKAIRLFCQECMGWQTNLVKDCTSKNCVLYPYRLGPVKNGLQKPEKDFNSIIETNERQR